MRKINKYTPEQLIDIFTNKVICNQTKYMYEIDKIGKNFVKYCRNFLK